MKTNDNGNLKRIGIMGGTFNPIHFGHLVAAENARVQFNLDLVYFIPTARPPHKDWEDIVDPRIRFDMVKLAVSSNEYFVPSPIEINREGKSYAIDTVRELLNFYNNEVELFFITGADALLEIETWKEIGELFRLCSFIAATRAGYGDDRVLEKIKEVEEKYNGNVYPMEIPALAVSSTDLRTRIKRNQPIKYLIPEEVEQYIYMNKLYV